MDLLAAMQVFVHTVDKGSLQAAAEASGISPTMAGKHLRSLEAHVGTRLLNRTTRRQSLTGFGQDYYLRCQEILRMVGESDIQAQNQQAAPTGTLRVTAPVYRFRFIVILPFELDHDVGIFWQITAGDNRLHVLPYLTRRHGAFNDPPQALAGFIHQQDPVADMDGRRFA